MQVKRMPFDSVYAAILDEPDVARADRYTQSS
jgi:hypothetical protein